MNIDRLTDLMKAYGYEPFPGDDHCDLRYVAGVVFKALGKPDIPVWETICTDGEAHIETFRPPEFIKDWVFEGGGDYGAFCGLYDDEDEED